jgi:hypothetical protein
MHLVKAVQTPLTPLIDLTTTGDSWDTVVHSLVATRLNHSVQLNGQDVVRMVGEEGSHHRGLSAHSQAMKGALVLRHNSSGGVRGKGMDSGLAPGPTARVGEHNDELVGDGVVGGGEAVSLPAPVVVVDRGFKGGDER